MAFDFKKAAQDAKKDTDNKRLFLLLLGASGNGKSYIQGSYGVKTLYLYSKGERHGPKTAMVVGKENIIPVCIDRDDNGEELEADGALARLTDILDDTSGLRAQGYKAIVVDGASEVEALIRASKKFKIATTSDTGKHNGFAEGIATLVQFRSLINKLKFIQNAVDCHICMTCTLSVRAMDDDGTITDAIPQLQGYIVPTSIIQQFDDVLIVGKMQKNQSVAYRLQLLAGGTKTSVDMKTQAIKKTFNFSPRLAGLKILALGSTLDADLSKIISLKEGV